MNYEKTAELLVNIIHENDLESSSSEDDIQLKLEEIVEANKPPTNTFDNQLYWLTNSDLDIDSVANVQLFIGIFTESYGNDLEEFKKYLNHFTNKVIEHIGKISKEWKNSEDSVEVKIYTINQTFEESLITNAYLKKIPEIKKKTTLTTYKNIITTTIDSKSLPLDPSKTQSFKINIDSRIEANKIDLDSPSISGYVFTANLFDIARIFNITGNELFDYNLRIGIEDKNDVDKSIHNTLLTVHEEFWYHNNGISMIIKKNCLDLNDPSHLVVNYSSDREFSIVNGAQTLTSALYFLTKPKISKILSEKNENEVEPEKLERIQNETKVLLRIIELTDQEFQKRTTASDKTSPISSTNQEQLDAGNNTTSSGNNEETSSSNKQLSRFSKATKISIALNRQKPINDDDIAYVVRFIEVINNLKFPNDDDNDDDNDKSDKPDISPYTFSIVRRGEGQNIKNYSYELMTFARIAKAYLATLPGPARSFSKASLLKIVSDDKTGDISFKDEVIFKDKEIYLFEEPSKYINTFNKYYKPVNYAVQLKDAIDKLSIDMVTEKNQNPQKLNSINTHLINYLREEKKSLEDQLSNLVEESNTLVVNESKKKTEQEKSQNFLKEKILLLSDSLIPSLVQFSFEKPQKLSFLQDNLRSTLFYGKYHLVAFMIHYLAGHKEFTPTNSFEKWSEETYIRDDSLEFFFFAFTISLRYASLQHHLEQETDAKLDFSSSILDESFSTNAFKLSSSNVDKLKTAYTFFRHMLITHNEHNANS